MSIYNKIDIAVTPSGDLSLSSTGDFDLVLASGVLKQDITFRVRTNYMEFSPHPGLGADLDSLIGEPNTRENAKIGELKIIHSLTDDTMIRKNDLYVKGMPISLEKIVYYIFVNDGVETLNVTPDVIFNMIDGVNNIPGA